MLCDYCDLTMSVGGGIKWSRSITRGLRLFGLISFHQVSEIDKVDMNMHLTSVSFF